MLIKSRAEIAKMRRSGRIVAAIHQAVADAVAPGVTPLELDDVAAGVLREHGARSSFLGYHGFPSHICTSVNDTIVHGIPDDRPLAEGDIIGIDAGAVIDGWHGDAAFTIGVGAVSEDALQLMAAAEDSLWAGLRSAVAGNRLSDIGHAIQGVAEAGGFSVVREYVGHAIGTSMHEPPQVPNFGPPGRGLKLKVGMTFAVEPMVNAGSFTTRVLGDGWTVKTKDGALSAHYEHTVAITEDGPEVLTLPDGEEPMALSRGSYGWAHRGSRHRPGVTNWSHRPASHAWSRRRQRAVSSGCV